MIKILIADDHELVREGLKKVIKADIDMKIIGEASNVSGIINFVINKDCDIILLDLNFPERSGFDVLQEIKDINKQTKIIILSMLPEKLYAERALKLGAWGYLSKGAPADEIVHAIRQVMNGKRYISDVIAQLLVENVGKDFSKPLHDKLSNREMDVLIKIANGKAIKKIADEMMISLSTANSYRVRMMKKMSFNSNSEIIYYAIKNGLIESKI